MQIYEPSYEVWTFHVIYEQPLKKSRFKKNFMMVHDTLKNIVLMQGLI